MAGSITAYWDSCVISQVLQKPHPADEAAMAIYAKRLPILISLLAESADDRAGLYLTTSVSPDVMDALWDSDVVSPVEVWPDIAAEARAIVRQSRFEKWTIKPSDAIHLATAKKLKCRHFHTYDGNLLKIPGKALPFEICEPNTRLVIYQTGATNLNIEALVTRLFGKGGMELLGYVQPTAKATPPTAPVAEQPVATAVQNSTA